MYTWKNVICHEYLLLSSNHEIMYQLVKFISTMLWLKNKILFHLKQNLIMWVVSFIVLFIL